MRGLAIACLLVGCSGASAPSTGSEDETDGSGGEMSGDGGSESSGGSSSGGSSDGGSPSSGGASGGFLNLAGSGSGGDIEPSGGAASGGATAGESSGGASGGDPSTGGASGGAPAGGDTGSGGAYVEPLEEMPVPSLLKDEATCWQDEFPNPVCKEVPDFDPPVLEWTCGGHVAKVAIPPNSCLRVSGRYQPNNVHISECLIDPTANCQADPGSFDNSYPNDTDEVSFVYLHRFQECETLWTAWWSEECP